MKLIFAQGNPGRDYENTRHNVGFMVIDTYAAEHNVEFTNKPKFNAEIAEISVSGDKVILVKPTTFYNETGIAARKLIDFYKLTPGDDMLVIHDDLALPFGTIRIRKKGSDAGNNGVKSLNAHIGPDYTRIRIGIHATEHIGDDAGYVLGRFNGSETKSLSVELTPKVIELVQLFLTDALNETSYRLS